MKLLIDTNVLLDMVLKRNGYDISVKLFRKIRNPCMYNGIFCNGSVLYHPQRNT